MGDIGEELQFAVIDFFVFLALYIGQFYHLLQVDSFTYDSVGIPYQ